MESASRPKRAFRPSRLFRPAIGLLFLAFLAWRLYTVLVVQQAYGPDTWLRFAISGIILGGVYAVIALGYTLVYGVLFMINFAHGDVMMLGVFAGYFTLESFQSGGPLTKLIVWLRSLLLGLETPDSFGSAGLLNQSIGWSIVCVLIAFIVGMLVGMGVAMALERIAYRPLRNAPRLVPLISAIGASLFLENAAQLMFGTTRRKYANPDIIAHNTTGFNVMVGGKEVMITYTGILTFALSILLMIGLFLLVKRTKMGKAMRAVAEDKEVAALMGIDVDRVISNTFAISGVLAGAAGVMWGLHMAIVYHYVGFLPGMKAFTAAVMGGIGNIPGAMLGGLALGVMESMAPAALGMPFQLKDVLAFCILVLVLIFRPTGLLGEVLSEKKM